MGKAGPENNWHYNRTLQPYARKLRMDMTKAEVCLWKYALKAGKLSNWQFRRQRPVLKYIADFMCKDLFLIIEVDGYTHQFEEALDKDLIREKELEKVGFKVIRFHDEEVLNDIENVRRLLEDVVDKRRQELKIPPHYPSRMKGTGCQRGKGLCHDKRELDVSPVSS